MRLSLTATVDGAPLVYNASDAKYEGSPVPAPKFGTPASAGAAGVQGQIMFDAAHIYFCTASNTWVRLAQGVTW